MASQTPTSAGAAGAIPAVPADRIGCADLFIAFSKMALAGFGGVLPFAYRALVERRQWLTAKEFAQLLAASQILPGPTICNIALMVGNRYNGTSGALAAMSGLIVGPFLIVIALGAVYQRYGNLDVFRSALGGMIAVAAGLILATAIKMAMSLFGGSGRDRKRTAVQAALLALAFIGLGVLKWRLIAVFLLVAPAGIAAFHSMGPGEAGAGK